MDNILVICAAGISTATLVKNMNESAVENNVKANITSVGIAAANEAIKDADVVLLGPQIGYLKPAMQDLVENKKSVSVIDTKVYGAMDGATALESALHLLED